MSAPQTTGDRAVIKLLSDALKALNLQNLAQTQFQEEVMPATAPSTDPAVPKDAQEADEPSIDALKSKIAGYERMFAFNCQLLGYLMEEIDGGSPDWMKVPCYLFLIIQSSTLTPIATGAIPKGMVKDVISRLPPKYKERCHAADKNEDWQALMLGITDLMDVVSLSLPPS
uniref:Uncharacterized 18.6 kDa protein in alpha-glucosidase 3'region n=1 Tax=Candida tsukubaensis TaxID=5483 RepID=YAGL_CANTS|nr:RecName: Full=Uncharacterized 18.6 kDa protein in alpha-glucosidase 3'region; AltName: Full=ORF2 [Pseudozyma tsukubaensis]CAA39502.1 hypothetical protein [Pseudozyma tsukubaensis]